MSELVFPGRADEELRKIREIVGGLQLPGFVTGFDIRLGEFDGEPSMWIEFVVLPMDDHSDDGVMRRGDDLVDLTQTVRKALVDHIYDRFPYFRFVEAMPS